MQDIATLTITKAELKDALHCTTWVRFYAKFMTDDVIRNELGIDRDQYKRIREFNVEQTRRLRRYFRLDTDKTV